MKSSVVVVLAVAQLGLVWGEARADSIVVDQAFLPTRPSLHAWIRSDVQPAQTFTVGIAGLLTRIDVLLTAEFPSMIGGVMELELRPTINGVPVEDDRMVLARTTLSTRAASPTAAAALVAADLSLFGLTVNRGDVFAIVVQSPGFQGASADWWGRTRASYRRGELFIRAPTFGYPTFTRPVGSTSSEGPYDLGFRTFVEASPVPEPATVLLIGFGIAATVARRRARSRT